MTYHRIDRGLAKLLVSGLDSQMDEKVAEWKDHLAAGRLSTEMRGAFAAFGWLTPRDSRLTPETETETTDQPTLLDAAAAVEVREPAVSPKRAKSDAGD